MATISKKAENERKRLLYLELFYLKTKEQMDQLEERLGIKQKKNEPIELHLAIRNENKNR